MKKILSGLFAVFVILFSVGCSSGRMENAIELMGAGERIHDSYTFANVGVKIKKDGNDNYTIYGSVEKFDNSSAKTEFNIDEDVDYVVVIKLQAMGQVVDEENLKILVDGSRAYDAEHLNGSDYTYIILEAVPGKIVHIKVNWNANDEKSYSVKFDENLMLK